MGTLFIVATPIGNLQDITLRALDTLVKVDFIACEDTRKTAILLKHFYKEDKEITKKLFSFYEEVENQKSSHVLNLLLNGKDVALVSDSGTPTISDPGFKLVRECIKNNIKVVSIPGPTAAISALVSSGLPTDKFLFLGFLPQKPGHRKKFLESVKKSQGFIETTVIFYESPHKIKRTLADFLEVFGNIEIVIARELTKIHEEVKKAKVEDFIEFYQRSNPIGEMTVLFNLK